MHQVGEGLLPYSVTTGVMGVGPAVVLVAVTFTELSTPRWRASSWARARASRQLTPTMSASTVSSAHRGLPGQVHREDGAAGRGLAETISSPVCASCGAVSVGLNSLCLFVGRKWSCVCLPNRVDLRSDCVFGEGM